MAAEDAPTHHLPATSLVSDAASKAGNQSRRSVLVGVDAHRALEGEEGGRLRETRLDAAEEEGRHLHSLRNDMYSDRADVRQEHSGHSVLHQGGDVEGVEQEEEGLGLGLGEDSAPHHRVLLVRRRRRIVWVGGGPARGRGAGFEERFHRRRPVPGRGTPQHCGVQVREEEAHACVEAGGGVRGGGGGEEAANQTERLGAVAGGPKEEGEGLVCRLPPLFEEGREGVDSTEAVEGRGGEGAVGRDGEEELD